MPVVVESHIGIVSDILVYGAWHTPMSVKELVEGVEKRVV